MLVHRLLEFIEALTLRESNLSESDAGILNNFKSRVSALISDDNLNEIDIQWLRTAVTDLCSRLKDDREFTNLVTRINKDINERYGLKLMPDMHDIIDENHLILNQSTDITELKFSRAYFDLFHLSTIAEYCPLNFLTSFKTQLAVIEGNIANEGYVDAAIGNEIKALFSLPWLSIIDNDNDINFSITLEYPTFWHYLVDEYGKDWQQKGELPINLLSELLTLIDGYYQITDQNNQLKFSKSLMRFINNLALESLENLNHLYSMVTEHNGKPVYLLQLIIECFQEASDVDSRLHSIARWIYSIDHSLIAKSEQLVPVYQNLRAGRSFDVAKLRELLGQLSQLPPEFPSLMNSKLKRLQQRLSRASNINEELIESIKELYSLRWSEVIDTWLDYTRALNELNKPWIALAQCLAGAGLINGNYYKLLIPTLVHDEEFTKEVSLTTYPLTHYILSDNNAELIYLDNCVGHSKANGTFYNCNSKEQKPLSEKEKQRVLKSLPIFANYFKESEILSDEPVIRKSTVDEIKKLVEKSLFPDGLYLGKEYTEIQYNSAEQAYENFLGFMATLPEDELINLFNQRIEFNNKRLIFSNLIQQVLHQDYLNILYSNFGHLIQCVLDPNEKRACVATTAQYLLKLVIDYNPEEEFPSITEQKKADIPQMRASSAKKIYRDYALLSGEEAIRRFRIIYVALMTHTFGYSFGAGHKLSVWDCVKTVTNTGKKIADLLNKVLFTHSEDPRFAYAMMETTIRRALDDNSMTTSLTRSADTEAWLKTILSKSMFEAANCTAFDPDLLLDVLWNFPMEGNSKLQAQRDLFLDQFLHTLVQDEDEHLKWIRINIKFADFLKEAGDARMLILKNLRKAPSERNTLKNIIDFSCHRFATNIALHESRNMLVFFATEPQMNETKYKKFRQNFYNELNSKAIPDDITVPDLLRVLHTIAIEVNSDKKITNYIDTLTQGIRGSQASYLQIVY